MNPEKYDNWINAVKEHMNMLDTLISDRNTLKIMFEEHLRKFFDYDDIEYNRDFTKITLKYNPEHNVFINPKKLDGLLMDFEVSANYNDKAERIINIQLYPFGVKEVIS